MDKDILLSFMFTQPVIREKSLNCIYLKNEF